MKKWMLSHDCCDFYQYFQPMQAFRWKANTAERRITWSHLLAYMCFCVCCSTYILYHDWHVRAGIKTKSKHSRTEKNVVSPPDHQREVNTQLSNLIFHPNHFPFPSSGFLLQCWWWVRKCGPDINRNVGHWWNLTDAISVSVMPSVSGELTEPHRIHWTSTLTMEDLTDGEGGYQCWPSL